MRAIASDREVLVGCGAGPVPAAQAYGDAPAPRSEVPGAFAAAVVIEVSIVTVNHAGRRRGKSVSARIPAPRESPTPANMATRKPST